MRLHLNAKNLTDRSFGLLTAIGPTDKRSNAKIVWICRCQCGNSVEVVSSSLTSGKTKSCGCLREELRGIHNKMKTHCPKEHPYNEENTYTHPDGRRECRICQRASSTRYRDAYRDKCREHGRKWNRRNRPKCNAILARYRAQKRDQTPELNLDEQQLVSEYYYFAQQLGSNWHVDHVIPVAKGGLHHPDNLQIITAEDNLKKSDLLDYIPEIRIKLSRGQRSL